MYKIKQIPEDFIVEEIFELAEDENGDYTYWLLTKKNFNTIDAIRRIADALHIHVKYISFSGNKDRNAITKQLISISKVSKQRIESLVLKDITLEYKGCGKDQLFLGSHLGNRFTITVRNIETLPRASSKIPNYFGEQRFSTDNVAIGRAIIKKDFKAAAEILGQSEFSVNESLEENPTNYIGAITKLPKKLLKLYVHSFQSYIWNLTVEQLLGNDCKDNPAVPIIGFATELGDNAASSIIKDIMKEEKLTLRDFIIRQMPELSLEGNSRKMFMPLDDLKIGELEEDELNSGMKKCTLSFSLPKGSYATVVIEFLFNKEKNN